MNRAGKYIFRLKRNGTGVRIPHSGTVRVEQLLNCGGVLPDALPNTNTLPLMDTDCAFFSNEPLQAFSRLAMPCGPEPAEHVFFACYDFAQNETRVSVTYTHKKAGQPKTKYKHKKPTSVTYGTPYFTKIVPLRCRTVGRPPERDILVPLLRLLKIGRFLVKQSNEPHFLMRIVENKITLNFCLYNTLLRLFSLSGRLCHT